MSCNDLDIKGLLPAYQGKMLSPADADRIEKHLSACEDCGEELSLLRMMSEEPVPDPGDAFWAAMPDRIHRAVWSQQRSGRRSPLSELLQGLVVPRWGWATSAVLMVAVVSLLLLRPVYHQSPATSAKHKPATTHDIITEALNGTDIHPGDLDQLSSWAHQELLVFKNGLADPSFNGNGALVTGLDFEDELAALSEEELDRLIDTLSHDSEEG